MTMRIKTEELFRCDACGVEKINPIGWSYIAPRTGGSGDFRSGVEDICSECYYKIKATWPKRS
jgi:hypothetical protein